MSPFYGQTSAEHSRCACHATITKAMHMLRNPCQSRQVCHFLDNHPCDRARQVAKGFSRPDGGSHHGDGRFSLPEFR
jgi:hypothetical protein